ncbi:phenylalanine--tRNA ligase subunit beta [Sediminivirga luteola]|uniref:Phenylalanine--tRNA ligase beta subunit n=1 Tax=Sediminivirga luteola TaxID=1774748 RepID=A0A8J2XMA7_9MICO|nr:phenylalanine--tRNA ligase subunit beta [Sediminivirga luteola]MCI2265323.1 phenylalanine--tRNA ligase subunit beta [Sediminivirga luteola]GGA24847.1 phenylalanine--tRNA ligase beta subunit [Sediminivirga luteola]
MRFPLTWLAELTDLPADRTGEDIAADLAGIGLEEEGLFGPEVTGPVVAGRVLSAEPEKHSNGKTVNWCQVDTGDGEPRGIVCGAHNFSAGDMVVVALPGAVLPGGFAISARKTYGHVSDGMICSAKELGLGEDHSGIIVLAELGLDADDLQPGQDAIALLGLDQVALDVNVTPDRGYQLSLRGLAREAAALYRRPFTDPVARLAPPAAGENGFPVVLRDEAPIHGAAGCDAFAALEVTGFDPAARTPYWMRRRLQQAGMRPISLAVDVTNYVMLELGQPLHAYDRALLGERIVVRRARQGETLVTLDDVPRRLHPEDLLITDETDGTSRIIGLAGVMGGAELEVGDSTSSVLIEAAHFDPISIARTARRHKLSTEASRRFERGVDPLLGAAAAQRCAELLTEYGGGTIEPAATVISRVQAPAPLRISAAAASRYIGVDYEPERAAELLERIGAGVSAEGDSLTVTPPSWRPDLNAEVDLYEEIARIGGYAEIPSVIPAAPGGRGLTDEQRARRRVANLLAADGYTEVLTYPFTSAARFEELGIGEDDPRRAALRLANPMSEDQPLLRTELLLTLVDAAVRNLGRGFKEVRLFEAGLVACTGSATGGAAPGRGPSFPPGYHPSDEELAAILGSVPAQPYHVAGIIAGGPGTGERAGVWGRGRPAEAGDVIDTVRRIAGIQAAGVRTRAAQRAPFHPGRTAEFVLADGSVLGHAGELHPKVCQRLGLPARSVAFEIEFDALLRQPDERSWPGVLSTYPVSRQDAALIVDDAVPAEDLAETLREGAGALLEDLELFDVYTGDQAGEGRKSLAFRFTFRAPDRTLTADEASALRQAAVELAAERHSAQLRG